MVFATKVEGECPFLRKISRVEHTKGIKGYLYCLGTIPEESDALGTFTGADQDSQCLLDTFLLSQWEDLAWKGQLGYDVTACETKIISGERKFVAQLNDKWNPLFLEEYENKYFQPFRSMNSNCMKNLEDTMLFFVMQGEKDKSELVLSKVPPNDGILVIANVNPVEYGHVFLIPYAIHQLPLFWDGKAFALAIKIAYEINNASFHVFFDYDMSIAPKNKYFQASYFANRLPVELSPIAPFYNGIDTTGILVSEVVGHPLKTLVFASKHVKTMIDVVTKICSTLHDRDSAFSLLITNCGTRIFLFCQVQGVTTGCQLHAWECGGYFVYHKNSDYSSASEQEISNRMLSVTLDESSFEDLKRLCCNIADCLVM